MCSCAAAGPATLGQCCVLGDMQLCLGVWVSVRRHVHFQSRSNHLHDLAAGQQRFDWSCLMTGAGPPTLSVQVVWCRVSLEGVGCCEGALNDSSKLHHRRQQLLLFERGRASTACTVFACDGWRGGTSTPRSVSFFSAVRPVVYICAWVYYQRSRPHTTFSYVAAAVPWLGCVAALRLVFAAHVVSSRV